MKKEEPITLKSELVLRGYIDHNDRIATMLKAGIDLEEWRKGHYDFDENYPEDGDHPFDGTRKKGYDIADASQDQRLLERKLKAKTKKSEDIPPVSENPTQKSEKKTQDGPNLQNSETSPKAHPQPLQGPTETPTVSLAD